MDLTEQIAVRVDKKLKQRIAVEVKSRRARGYGSDGADVVREALIEYFERRVSAEQKAVAA